MLFTKSRLYEKNLFRTLNKGHVYINHKYFYFRHKTTFLSNNCLTEVFWYFLFNPRLFDIALKLEPKRTQDYVLYSDKPDRILKNYWKAITYRPPTRIVQTIPKKRYPKKATGKLAWMKGRLEGKRK